MSDRERRQKERLLDTRPLKPPGERRRLSLNGEVENRLEGHHVRTIFESRSFGGGMGYGKQELHDSDFFPDPIPAVRVINKPEHTTEMMNQEWVPQPIPYDRSDEWNPSVKGVTHVYRTVADACRATDWAVCARFLGDGTYGNVYLGFRLSEEPRPLPDRHLCAVKMIYNDRSDRPVRDMMEHPEKASTSSSSSSQPAVPFADTPMRVPILTEIQMLSCLKHNNILRMLAHFAVEERKAVCLILEFCDNRDLWRELRSTPGKCFSKFVARYYFKQIMTGVAYLHSVHVVHTDLKLENILVKIHPDGRNKIVKIADFDFAFIFLRQHEAGKQTIRKCSGLRGTLAYAPPEILAIAYQDKLREQISKPYRPHPMSRLDKRRNISVNMVEPPVNRRRQIYMLPQYFGEKIEYPAAPVDIYCCGVILYLMLTGEFPYEFRKYPDTLDHVFRCQPTTCFSRIDTQTWDLIRQMLEPLTEQQQDDDRPIRPTADQVLHDSWMQQVAIPNDPFPQMLDEFQRMRAPFPEKKAQTTPGEAAAPLPETGSRTSRGTVRPADSAEGSSKRHRQSSPKQSPRKSH